MQTHPWIWLYIFRTRVSPRVNGYRAGVMIYSWDKVEKETQTIEGERVPDKNPYKACYNAQYLLPLFLFSFILRASCAAYGKPQARGRIGAAASGLHHSHSNHRIWAPPATYPTAQGSSGYSTHRARPGTKPSSSWFLVGFVNAEPKLKLHISSFFRKYTQTLWNRLWKFLSHLNRSLVAIWLCA